MGAGDVQGWALVYVRVVCRTRVRVFALVIAREAQRQAGTE